MAQLATPRRRRRRRRRALLDRNPEDLSALEGLAVTQARLGAYEEAADLLDKLVAKRPGAPQ